MWNQFNNQFPILLFSETFLSVREGAWVVGRMGSRGLPMDMMLLRRAGVTLLQLLPRALLNWVLERAYNQKYDHRLYGLQPSYRYGGAK